MNVTTELNSTSFDASHGIPNGDVISSISLKPYGNVALEFL